MPRDYSVELLGPGLNADALHGVTDALSQLGALKHIMFVSLSAEAAAPYGEPR